MRWAGVRPLLLSRNVPESPTKSDEDQKPRFTHAVKDPLGRAYNRTLHLAERKKWTRICPHKKINICTCQRGAGVAYLGASLQGIYTRVHGKNSFF